MCIIKSTLHSWYHAWTCSQLIKKQHRLRFDLACKRCDSNVLYEWLSTVSNLNVDIFVMGSNFFCDKKFIRNLINYKHNLHSGLDVPLRTVYILPWSRYLLLPALLGDLALQQSAIERLDALTRARVYFVDYLQRCKSYSITQEVRD